MNKPNRSKEITKEEQDILDVIDVAEYIDGYKSDDLQHYLDF